MEKKIYLIFINGVERFIGLKEIEESVKREFGFEIERVHKNMDEMKFYDPRRRQYHSTKILKEILLNFPKDAVKALGIVPFDLFIPILTFVFGEAQLNGKVGIVSIARLRQEFYGLPPNQSLLQRRVIKEIKHELGHTFGLVHCPERRCVMSLANSVLDVDSKGLTFCDNCKDLLHKMKKRL